MLSKRVFAGIGFLVASFLLVGSAAGDTYQVILTGKVAMEDGSAPPFTVGIQKNCTDGYATAPGPIANKKGDFLWKLEFDPYNPRTCFLEATYPGYVSSRFEISSINATSHDPTFRLPVPLVLSRAIPAATTIIVADEDLPSKAKTPFRAAMKALDAGNSAEAASQLEIATAAYPKSAQLWHALAIVQDNLQKPAEARKADERAIADDSKLLPAYVTLAHECVKTKDWQCASQTADTLIKTDTKHLYPEIYLHRATALYELKDLAGAEASVREAIRLDPAHKRPREEYVLGRILEAKGDVAGAKEHMAKYLELEPAPVDVTLVRGHLENLGKPEAKDIDPALEP